MVKFSGKYVAVFATCLAFLFTACGDKDLSIPGPGEEDDDNNDQPSLLDYSTTQSVKFNLVYDDAPKGYAATFEVYSENPFIEEDFKMSSEPGAPTVKRPTLNTNLTPISGGISISGKYNLTKTIPSYVKELYVYSTSMFVPTLMKATIQNGVADFTRVDLTDEVTRNSSPATRTVADKRPDFCLLYEGGGVGETSLNASNDLLLPNGAVGPNHEPCIAVHHDIPGEVLSKINAAFPEKQKVEKDSPYLSEASLYLNKPAQVWISIIHTGAQWENTLGYFYHDGPANELVHENRTGITNKEIIAIPLAKLKTSDSKLALQSGDYVQLKYFNETTQQWENEFPAGLTIGWLLHPKSYDRTNKRLAASGWQWPLCSINTLNTDGHRIDCIVFDAGTEAKPFVCVGFEDDYRRNNYPAADEDFNDLIFHVLTDPIDAIKPVEPIPSEEEDVETTVNKKGILAFEDNWPSEGDYDLNDVVMRYSSKATLTCKPGEQVAYMTKLEDRFSLIHTGADLPNKFGFKVNIDPSYVKSISVNGKAHTYIKDNFDGIGFIVDLCNDATNTPPVVPYQPNTQPFHYDIVMEFEDGITEEQWEAACAPYNPFITPKDKTEVHLPYYPPTDRADLSHFGTKHDRSDVEKKIYYVSGEKVLYPFALHLSGVDTFINLGEHDRINITYPDYDNWVKSNGKEYRDWYLK
ncbi:LruC domain-containing protein [Bacteroides sp. 51]|uniref:LruC domain-containing protein n=1 Tax=Bacteroides sp. 51 TaxID=2302938 RepID=UPI0013D3B38C|nr:LruC domain-containing protein [Bacteroides sp. 51]NDV80587.1 LruC domain-containing protein [Bacteroides sp. 51]